MNGKLPLAPLVGELVQLAGILTIIVTAVALALVHRWQGAAAIVIGCIAFGVGRYLRRDPL